MRENRKKMWLLVHFHKQPCVAKKWYRHAPCSYLLIAVMKAVKMVYEEKRSIARSKGRGLRGKDKHRS